MRLTLPWLRAAMLLVLACGMAELVAAQSISIVPVHGPLDRAAVASKLAPRSAMLGLAQAGPRLVAVGERGIVVLSDDQGSTWRQAAVVPVSVTLTTVQFVDAQHGYTAGHYGVVLRTKDGGEHWVRILDGGQAAALILKAAQQNSPNDSIARKALQDAQRLVADGPDKPWLAMHFSDAQHGLLVGAYGLAMATEDGGKTWQSWMGRLPNGRANHLYAIAQINRHIWIGGEQGLLLHSADAGASFVRVALPYAGSLFTVNAVGDAVVAAGLRGNVWCTTDEGKDWEHLALPAPISITASLQDATGALYLANQAGQILVSHDGVHSFTNYGQSSSTQIGALTAVDSHIIAAGWGGVVRVEPGVSGRTP